MKQLGKRLSLAIVLLLSALLMLCGGAALLTARAEEGKAQGVTTHEGDFYTLTYDENAPSVELLIDADILDYSTSTNFRELGTAMKEVVTDLFVKGILKSGAPASASGIATVAAIPDLGGLTQEDVEKYIKEHLSSEEELGNFIDGQYDMLLQYAVDSYVNAGGTYEDFQSKVDEIFEEIVEEVFKDEPDTQAQFKADLATKTEELVTDVQENGVTTPGFGEIIDRLVRITVNGNVIFENSKFVTDGVKALLNALPRLGQIAETDDLSHLLQYQVSVETDLGNFTFGATFGFKGEDSELRTLLRFADRHIAVTTEEGVHTAAVTVPRACADFLLRFINSETISQGTKDTLLSLLGTKKLGEYTFQEAKAVFDELLKFINDDHLTELFKGDETMISVANKILNKFKNDKAFYEKCMRKAETLFGEIPARIKELSAVELYKESGLFSYSDSFKLGDVMKKGISVLESLGIDLGDIADTLANYLDTDLTAALAVNVQTDGLYKITYQNEDTVKEMLLPVGAEIAQFGDVTEEGAYWVDAEDTQEVPTAVETMPEHDIIVKLFREPKIIDLTGATWEGNPTSAVYDENDHINDVALKGVDADTLALIKYVWTKDGEEVTEAKEVGEYTITVAPLDGEYTIENGPGAFTFEITEPVVDKTIDLEGATWDGKSSVVYDGKDHINDVTLKGVGADTLALIKYVWTKDGTPVEEVKEVGVYKVTVAPRDAEYTIKNGPKEFTFEITAPVVDKTVDLTGATWEGNGSVVYDGNDHIGAVTLKGVSAEDAARIQYVWTKDGAPVDEAIDAGEYTVSVQLTAEAAAAGYQLTNQPVSAQLTITPMEIDVSAFEWDYPGTPIKYDGKAHTVSLKELPDYVDVTYTGNTATEVGQYEATATLSTDKNHSFKDGKNTLTLSWEIYEDSEEPPYDPLIGQHYDEVYVYDDNDLFDGTVEIEAVNAEDYQQYEKLLNAILTGDYDGKEGTLGAAYDITFKRGDTIVSEPGEMRIRIRIPDTFSGEGRTLVIVHFTGNGAELIEAEAVDGYYEFRATSFSVYAIAELVDEAAASLWWMWLLIALIIVLLIATIVLLVILLKKKQAEAQSDGELVEETTEEPAEETVEETTEETVEEVPAEEPVEEPVEETPVEEPVEEPAEEAPVEEPVEEPAEEAPVEEPVEEPAEEAPAEEPVIPAIIAVESKEENMKAQQTELAAAEATMYDRSFTARIAQADESVRGYYHELKAELLSYKGVKSRISWTADSYNKGRGKCAKLQIKGKTLVLYLALDPEEVATKYHAQNVSDIAKYAEVPTKLRLRNPRSLKYAKELIAQLMEKMGIVKAAHAPAVQEIPVQTTEQLIEGGFIKCKKGSRPGFWGKKND